MGWGIDALERAEPSIMAICSLSEFSTAVRRAVCVEAMHTQGETSDTPISTMVDYAKLKALNEGGRLFNAHPGEI